MEPRLIKLKNGEKLIIGRLLPPDAREALDYLRTVGGETDFLLTGSEGLGLSVEAERDFLEAQAQKEDSIFVCGKIDGEIVTIASLTTPGQPRIAHTTEMGISVAKRCWGLGVGTAATHALLDFARGVPSLRLVHLAVHAGNTRAIALYKRFGFAEYGRLEDFFYVGGAYHGEVLMVLPLRRGEGGGVDAPNAPKVQSDALPGAVIRPAQLRDLNGILALYAQLHSEDTPAPGTAPESTWRRILTDADQQVLVAELAESGQLAASCVCVTVPNLTRGMRPYMLIENVVTDESCRRRGFAGALLRHAAGLARAQNAYKIMLMTSSKDEGVWAFYEQAGFNRQDKTAFVQWL